MDFFYEKLKLFDRAIKLLPTSNEPNPEIIDLGKDITKWLESNTKEDDDDYFLLEQLRDNIVKWNVWELKIVLQKELVERRSEIGQTVSKEEELEIMKNKLSSMERERSRILDQFAYEKNKAAENYDKKIFLPPDASTETIRRLKDIDDAIEKMENELHAFYKAMNGLGCQLCGEEAKYTCQVYYCGSECQIKHLK